MFPPVPAPNPALLVTVAELPDTKPLTEIKRLVAEVRGDSRPSADGAGPPAAAPTDGTPLVLPRPDRAVLEAVLRSRQPKGGPRARRRERPSDLLG